MLSSITSATQAQPAAPVQRSTTTRSTAPPKPQSAPAPAVTDTVQLSAAAQARLAAMQENAETPAQTAQEAAGGDLQAQRLLASEQAAKAAEK
jgi:hypothetical protein